jgi:hypothetical protein
MGRAAPPWLRPGFRVRVDPTLAHVEPGEILVGLGDERRHGRCVVLNHKPGRHGVFQSVTEYVCSRAAPVEAWRGLLAPDDGLKVVVEDASLDTCYGLLALMERLEPGCTGVPLAGPWVAYVTAWEQGALPDAGAFESSVGVLLGQLSVGRALPEALVAGLEVLRALSARSENPFQADLSAGGPLVAEARARVRAEVERFEALRQRAEVWTLALPRADGLGTVTVQGLVGTYTERLGLTARLARARGFGLTALHCAAFAGLGNDMVVAAEPSLGVTLRALWEALERLEDARWGGARPRSHPRRIRSYEGRTDGPDEPWWDDLGRYSLVAAPKSVVVDGEQLPGSRVAWEDVRGLLARLYRRGRDGARRLPQQ